MKLNSNLIEPSYSTFNPMIARDRVSFVQKMREIISNILNIQIKPSTTEDVDSELDLFEKKIKNRDDAEINSILSILIEYLDNEKYHTNYCIKNILLLTRSIIDEIYSKTIYNEDTVNKLKYILDKVTNIVSDNFSDDISIDVSLRYVGTKINFIVHKFNNDVSYDHRFITPLDRNTDIISINELISENAENGVTIKSIANYSDTRYFPQLTSLEFSPSDYINSIYHESDDDYVINKIRKLPDFLKSIISKENCYDAFVHICEFLYNKFANNTTALTLMRDALLECKEIVNSMQYLQYQQKESCERLNDYCKKLINFINGDNDRLDDKVCVDSSPLIEMGFGYIYDILPSNIEDINESTIDSIGKAMVEAVDYFDIMNVLSEASFSKNDRIRNRIKQETENDIYRQRLQDEYADERRRAEDKYADERRIKDDKYSDERRKKDDKYSDKRRKQNDDYDFKRREEQDEYEKKKEEKERKKNATKTAWSRWKTMELTNATAYSATRALKRLLAATAVGGVAYAAGFNPVFLPIVYLLSKYMGDKANPEKEKLKIMKEIKSTQNIIESKIEQADRQNDMKQKYQLMRMRDKLESQFKQMGYSSTSGIGGKV